MDHLNKNIFSNYEYKKIAFGLIGILLIGLLIFNLKLLKGSTVYTKQSSASNVYDATRLISESKYRFLKSLEYSDLKYTIFLLENKYWFPTTFGKNELKTLTGFENKDGIVLQKIKLKIPKELQNLNQPIVFYIPSILFSRYQIFVNGRIVSDNVGLKFPFSTALVSILRSDIDGKNEVQIGIRGIFKSTDNGVSFYIPSLVGPQSEFQNIYVDTERADNTYYNIILALKSGLLIFFLILYLVTKPQKFMDFFLISAICNTLATLFIMDRLEDFLPLNIRAFFMFNLQLIGYAFLWFFIESLYEVKYKIQKNIILLQILSLNLILILFLFGKGSVDIRTLFKIHYAYITEILFAITLLSINKYLYRPNQKIAKYSSKLLASILIFNFLIHVWLHYFSSNYGNNSHQPVDLLFFIFVGFIAASEFLKNQVKIVELNNRLTDQATEVELGKSASRIAHDIRKPFNNLKIALDVIHKSNFNINVMTKVFSEINNTIEYGEELASQILATKKNDIKQLKPCIPAVILEKYYQLEKRLLENECIIFRNKNKSTQSLLGEETMIVSIIQNIINNAIEAFGSQDNKVIECVFEDFQDSLGTNMCRLIISNNGPPIPKQVISHLFKKSITYGKTKGTGIGLTGVKTLVDKMNAEIFVYNLAGNAGVAFEIIFQTIETPNSYIGQQDLKNLTEDNKKELNFIPKSILPKIINHIVVVDDDDLIRMSWKIIWSEDEIDLFESPEQLFLKIANNPSYLESVDVIITDQFFGKISNLTGIDVCNHLKQMKYDNIILCSGDVDIENYLKIGFRKIIEKQILTKNQLQALLIGNE